MLPLAIASYLKKLDFENIYYIFSNNLHYMLVK